MIASSFQASPSAGQAADQITVDIEKAFSAWHEVLIKNENEQEQQAAQEQLLEAVKQGKEALAALLREKLDLRDLAPVGMPDLPRQLTPGEASKPPVELERELWHLWQGKVFPNNATRPVYWNIAYTCWIEKGLLGDNLYKTLAPSNPKTLDKQTRSVLRNLGGLPRARGNVSTFSNCPMARAWWRCHVAHDATAIAGNPNLIFEDAHQALHKNAIWESLAMNSLRRVTVVNDSRLRSAIIEYLAAPVSKATNDTTCSQLIQNLAQLMLFYSPSLLSWESLSELVQTAAETIDAKAEADPDDELDDTSEEDEDEAPSEDEDRVEPNQEHAEPNQAHNESGQGVPTPVGLGISSPASYDFPPPKATRLSSFLNRFRSS